MVFEASCMIFQSSSFSILWSLLVDTSLMYGSKCVNSCAASTTNEVDSQQEPIKKPIIVEIVQVDGNVVTASSTTAIQYP